MGNTYSVYSYMDRIHSVFSVFLLSHQTHNRHLAQLEPLCYISITNRQQPAHEQAAAARARPRPWPRQLARRLQHAGHGRGWGLPLEAWRSTSHVAWGLAEGGGVSICVFGCVFCVYSLVGWIHSVSCVSGPPNLCIAHLGRTEQVPTYFGQPALPTYRTTFHGPRTATPAARAQPHPLCG